MSEQTGPSPEDALLPHPAYSAMLICDMAIREEGTGKVSLIGIFENVSATVFPARHPLLCVYCKLTDAQGDYAFRLELVRGEDLVVIGGGEFRVSVPGRRDIFDLIFQLGGLVFERPGAYEFQLSANGRHVAGKSFNVVQVPSPSGG